MDNLPPGDTWIEALDVDHNGNRCLTPSLAPEYRADMRLPRPQPSQELLDFYHHNAFEPSLEFDDAPSDVVLLLDTLSMKSCAQRHAMRVIDQLAVEEKRFIEPATHVLATLGRGGGSAITNYKLHHHRKEKTGWLGQSIFFLLSTHLDHPSNLNAAVAEAAKFAQDHLHPGGRPIKGIILSILHVVGIEVSSQEGKLCARHTAAIPLFDGSWGICRDGLYMLRQIISRQRTLLIISKPDRQPSNSQLPFELWRKIVSLVDDLDDLKACTLVDSYFFLIATPLLDAPHFRSFRITKHMDNLFDGTAASFEVDQGGETFVLVTLPDRADPSPISHSANEQLKKLALASYRSKLGKGIMEVYVFRADVYGSEDVRAIFHLSEVKGSEAG
jgi:hypothetical protein